MFAQAWNKYLPIIKILMKRSATENQSLDMNQTDFERAAGGRKAKFTFNVALHKGRIQNVASPSPVAKELATILQEDEITRKLVREFDYEFSMNGAFQLTIKQSLPETEAAAADDEDTAADADA